MDLPTQRNNQFVPVLICFSIPFSNLNFILYIEVSGQLLLQEPADPCVSETKVVLLKSGNWLVSSKC